MLNKLEIYNLIDKVLSEGKYFTSVSLKYMENALTRFANSEIHQNVYSKDCEIDISVFRDKKMSKLSTNVLDETSLLKTLKEAEENLEFLPQGDYKYTHVDSPKFLEYEDPYIHSSSNLDIEDRATILEKCLNSLPVDYLAAGALSRTVTILAFGNSNKIKRFTSRNSQDFNVVVMHKDGASGYGEITANNPKDFLVEGTFKKAYEKAVLGLNPVSLEPGTYDVILEPLAVSEYVSMSSYIGVTADSIKDGVSFLEGKKGEKVFDPKITIKDDWKNKDSFHLPFDFEGYERKCITIFENGVFKNIISDSKNANLLNEENTGHSLGYGSGSVPLHLVMDGGDKTLAEIIKSTKRALLITRFHYMNIVNPRESLLTGLTRDGVFLVEDGEIKCAVKDMRFTESILNAFNNVEEISSDREKINFFLGPIIIPAMKIKNFHFTGKTE
ncbi:TldD/PmbA family protein [Clostridium sp. Marseille-QA1073]